MSSILYNNFEFPSGYSCKICQSCCVGRIEPKNAYDHFPWTIDWAEFAKSEAGFGFCLGAHNIIDVETVVYRDCDGEIKDCEASAEFMATSPTQPKNRRELQGPVSRFRIGGGAPGHYRVGVRVIYGQGCEKYDWSGCWDLEIVDPC